MKLTFAHLCSSYAIFSAETKAKMGGWSPMRASARNDPK